MKAITCTTPGTFVFSDEPFPERKPGEALVKIHRIGVCGTDLHAFTGQQPFFTYPRVLGHELCGEVVELDADSEGLAIGDLVTIVPYLECGTCVACRNGKTNCCVALNVLGVHSDGGMREYMSIPVDHLIKNTGLTLDQLAMVECFAIGAHAVRRAQIRKKEIVLVVGAGPIGLGLMQFARLAGGEVIVMDVAEDRLEFTHSKIGIQKTINASQENARDQLSELTGGCFPTVIFDCTGNRKSMMDGFLNLAHGGRYVLVGLVTSDITFSDPEFHKRETTLMSSRNATKEDFQWVMSALEEGAVCAEPLVTHRCHFDQLLEQFEGWGKPESGVVKAIIEM